MGSCLPCPHAVDIRIGTRRWSLESLEMMVRYGSADDPCYFNKAEGDERLPNMYDNTYIQYEVLGTVWEPHRH